MQLARVPLLEQLLGLLYPTGALVQLAQVRGGAGLGSGGLAPLADLVVAVPLAAHHSVGRGKYSVGGETELADPSLCWPNLAVTVR